MHKVKINIILVFVLVMILNFIVAQNSNHYCPKYECNLSKDSLKELVDIYGKDCFEMFDTSGSSWITNFIIDRKFEMVKFCFENGMDFSKTNKYGDSPFSMLCNQGLIEWIVSNGYKPSSAEIKSVLWNNLENGIYGTNLYFNIDSFDIAFDDIIEINHCTIGSAYDTLKSKSILLEALFIQPNKNAQWFDVANYLISAKKMNVNLVCKNYNRFFNDEFYSSDLNTIENLYYLAEMSSSPLLYALYNYENKFNYDSTISNSYSRYYKVVELLLKKGASANFLREDGTTALHYAVSYCDIDLVNLLIKYGADVNVENINGWTPLLIALKYECGINIVEVLLDNGSSINSKNIYGQSAMELASSKDILQMIVSSKK